MRVKINLFAIGVFFLTTFSLFAQTDGITYQAVIIGPDILELPGVDSKGNYLPNAQIAMRFTIFDSGNQVEFQEVQITTTDEFGRINLIIGAVEHDYFETISWDGTAKDLKVEIDFNAGTNFIDMSRETLTFVPYAYHRNITATGTLTVDDDTFLNRELTVNGPTVLNSTFNVEGANASYLTGDLTVDGETNLESDLNVNNQSATNLSGAVTVGESTGFDDVNAPTLLNGTLDVVGKTTVVDFESTGLATFNDLVANTLRIDSLTTLHGEINIGVSNDDTISMTGEVSMNSDKQIKIISSSLTGPSNSIDNHPVLIDGGNNGLAIRVSGPRKNATNFITFFDTTRDESWGRIEGEMKSEYTKNDDYNFDQRSLAYDIADGVLDLVFAGFDVYAAATGTVMAVSSATGCGGFGACVTAPIPSMIAKYTTESVVAGLQLVTATAAAAVSVSNKVIYDNNKDKNQGVTYASGAGDYAEYLLRSDVNETMSYGDIVGVYGGEISKNTEGADRMMVVSYKPIVLGNMPQENKESQYEKVAFMGQVPVKVFGKVNIGDYIIPSNKNDGVGIAIPPSNITSKDIKNIVGVAWSSHDNILGFGMINLAVGLNTNDNNIVIEKLEAEIKEQSNQITYLKNQIEGILLDISRFKNVKNISFTDESVQNDTIQGQDKNSYKHRKHQVIESVENDIVYFEFTKDDIKDALVKAEESMRENGLYEANKEVLEKINSDSNFKNKFINQLEIKIQNTIHYHKEIDKKGGY